MNKTTGKFDALCGQLKYVLTSGNHVFIEEATDDSGQHVAIYGTKGAGRNIPHHISFHLYLQENGAWAVQNNSEAYITRRDRFMADPTTTCRKQITECVTASWNEFITQHPELLTTAEGEYLEKEIERVKGEMAEKQAELRELGKELSGFEIRQMQLQGYDVK